MKKVLTGWVHTKWIKNFHYQNITKQWRESGNEWIIRLGGNTITIPKIYRSPNKHIGNAREQLLKKIPAKKIRITIEEIK